ncbi:MAG: rRNA maturation RNase YbeY [Bacilli bacterium]|nr:rRNA maturation RNase YbeY [Bacilli bacterium]
MNKIEFNNLTDEEVQEEQLLNDVLMFAMEKEKLENTSFDVIFVDNQYIHELNKNYRNIDRETDVITFALEDDNTIINGSDIRMLGDIYISLDKAHLQAKEYGHSFKRELSFLAVHGFYHLLGYDHMTEEDEKVMFGKQEEVLEEFNITREV